jgi:hypothetical protein
LLLQYADRKEVLMTIRNFFMWIVILVSCGFLNSRDDAALGKTPTVLLETEMKIERGNCFVFQKPF